MQIHSLGAATWVAVAALGVATASADEQASPTGQTAPTIAHYKTGHFSLHTDLSGDQALAALEEMEAALSKAQRYWREPLHGQIECYLAKDVVRWPEGTLPNPLGRVWIGGVGGATICQPASGRHPARQQVTIYAAARPGVLPHEVVHAYCFQTFGYAGPDWYKEGMAEVAAHSASNQPGVCCPEQLLAVLRRARPRSAREIVRGGNFTHDTARSLNVLLANRIDTQRPVLMSHWSEQAGQELADMRPAYAYSWALCHFLANNPNYSAEFRRLGTQYLNRRSDRFEKMFGPVWRQLDFEFGQFMENIGVGYRVDLCAWDWDKQFHTVGSSKRIIRRIDAARGYQPTGLLVESGQRYSYVATGSWSTGPLATISDAGGTPWGLGRLTAVVFHDFQLSEPVELGADGTFTASESGKLYVRCQDAWQQLADNEGSVVVSFSQ